MFWVWGNAFLTEIRWSWLTEIRWSVLTERRWWVLDVFRCWRLPLCCLACCGPPKLCRCWKAPRSSFVRRVSGAGAVAQLLGPLNCFAAGEACAMFVEGPLAVWLLVGQLVLVGPQSGFEKKGLVTCVAAGGRTSWRPAGGPGVGRAAAKVMKDLRVQRGELAGAKRVAATELWVRKVRAKLAGGAAPREALDGRLKRKKAYSWLVCYDHMVRESTSFGGLQAFEYPAASRPADPWSWRLLICTMDQGSDGLAAASFLRHQLEMNFEVRFGPSHRSWSDTKAALRYAQLWCHEILQIICYNAEFGKWHDDERCWQVRDVVSANFRALTEPNDEVFHMLMDGVLEDSGLEGELGDAGIRSQLYQYLVEAPIWKKKFRVCGASA